MCYHVKFGSAASKGVSINIEWNPKIGEVLGPAPLRSIAWWPIEKHLPTCVILPKLVVLGQTVRALLRSAWKIWSLCPAFKVTQGHRNRDKYRFASCDFLLTFHSNNGPISYRFWDKWWFQSKIANFPTRRAFCDPLKGLPLKLHTGIWGQKPKWWGYRAEKEVWRYLQPSGYHRQTWQTDGHRATAKTALTHGVTQ